MTDAAIDDRCERLEAGEKLLKTEAWCPSAPPPGSKKPCYHTSEEVITHLKDEPVSQTLYRSMVGTILWVSQIRPDIATAVSILSQFLTDPRLSHLIAAKRVLRYLKGTV